MKLYDDVFAEELVARRGGLSTILIQAGIVAAALVLIVLSFLFLSAIFPALLAIIVYGAYLAMKFQGVEYEYSFTNGDLDIDKIMAKRKRKKLVEINHKDIRVMAPYTAEYESETKSYQVTSVIHAESAKNSAGQWFLIYENDMSQYVFVVFQPSKRFRDAMARFMRSKIKGMEA